MNELFTKVFRVLEVTNLEVADLLNIGCFLILGEKTTTEGNDGKKVYYVGQYRHISCKRCGQEAVEFIPDSEYVDKTIYGLCHKCHDSEELVFYTRLASA